VGVAAAAAALGALTATMGRSGGGGQHPGIAAGACALLSVLAHDSTDHDAPARAVAASAGALTALIDTLASPAGGARTRWRAAHCLSYLAPSPSLPWATWRDGGAIGAAVAAGGAHPDDARLVIGAAGFLGHLFQSTGSTLPGRRLAPEHVLAAVPFLRAAAARHGGDEHGALLCAAAGVLLAAARAGQDRAAVAAGGFPLLVSALRAPALLHPSWLGNLLGAALALLAPPSARTGSAVETVEEVVDAAVGAGLIEAVAGAAAPRPDHRPAPLAGAAVHLLHLMSNSRACGANAAVVGGRRILELMHAFPGDDDDVHLEGALALLRYALLSDEVQDALAGARGTLIAPALARVPGKWGEEARELLRNLCP
jgi:hypothetical protein